MAFRPRRDTKASIFAAALADGATPAAAATSAGYKSPHKAASQLLAKPSVRRQVDSIARARNILEDVAPAIAAHHVNRLTRGSTTNREFAQLSSIYYKTIGMMDMKPTEEKELYEMSTEELRAKLAELEREASERAKPIGGVFD